MKFRRNTHNADGSYRFEQDHKFEHWSTTQTDEQLTRNGEMGLALHMLDSKAPATFDELVLHVQRYNEEFHEDISTPADIALGLVRLIEDSLVVVEPEFRVHCGLKSNWEPTSV
jgi:hypothetical protein